MGRSNYEDKSSNEVKKVRFNLDQIKKSRAKSKEAKDEFKKRMQFYSPQAPMRLKSYQD